jgi:hypothetical protein
MMNAFRVALLMTTLAMWSGCVTAQTSTAQTSTVPTTTTSITTPTTPTFSADGLYNLGNAYARAGKPGLAVLSYERATLLAPGDADINANLDFVRAAAGVPGKPRNLLARVVRTVNPAAAAWLGVLGIALSGSALLARRVVPRFRSALAGGVVLGIVFMTVSVSSAVLMWPRLHEAVVLVDQAPARVTPALMGEPAFLLREAETVAITAEHEDFILIRTAGNRVGWVARADLGAVAAPANGSQAR